MMVPFEAYELSAWAKRAGADDPLPYLRDMALIDTDMLRDIGTRVWGLEYRAAPVPDELVEHARRTWDRLLEDVSPTWSNSIAYDNFRSHMETIRDAMIDEEAARFPTVGHALVAIADIFDVAWYEILSWVVTALGLIATVVGTAFAAATAWTGVGGVAGVVTAVVGLIIAAAAGVVTYWNSTKPRLAALVDAGTLLDSHTRNDSIVDDLQLPDAVAGWDAARNWHTPADE